MARLDLSGQVFGRLTAVERQGRKWLCRCACGAMRLVWLQNLRRGLSQSCGCLRDELAVTRATRHGLSGQPEYPIWQAMLRRCRTPSDTAYPWYGARGIRVCDEWVRDFTAFFRDVGPRPPRHSIDRIDPAGHYEPSNVRWAPMKEQAVNRGMTVYLEHGGRRQHLSAWARELGISHSTLSVALKRGLPFDEFVRRHQAQL